MTPEPIHHDATTVTIFPWDPAREAELARAFHDINTEWITAMFTLEAKDRDVLTNPRERIIGPGGDILFADVEGLGIVGTCALMPVGGGAYELTKMGVLASARGAKAGEALLAAVLDRARAIGVKDLFLLTNCKCAAAIHLYEKLGFSHDASVMAEHGGEYVRCDVAMRYPLARPCDENNPRDFPA